MNQALMRLDVIMDYLIEKAGISIAEKINEEIWYHVDKIEKHPEIG